MPHIELSVQDLNVNVTNEVSNTHVIYVPDLNVKVASEINNTRVILRQPTTLVSQTSPYLTFAESAVTASFALVAQSLSGPLSASLTVQELIVNNNIYVNKDLYVTGSISGGSFKLNAGMVNLIFTGSVTSGIFGATEYIEPPLPTSSYSGASVEYIARRDGSIRMGILMSTWNNSNIVFTDVSTVDIGDTSDVTFSFVEVSGNIRLRVYSAGSGSGNWTVQSLFKLFPTL